ncbi:hypothetical protein BH10PSE1_BH10PSE1_22560 [soil metagenome]
MPTDRPDPKIHPVPPAAPETPQARALTLETERLARAQARNGQTVRGSNRPN